MRLTAVFAVPAIALLLGGAPASAADTAASANEAKVVGAWSENFPEQAAHWNAEQRAQANKTGLVRDVAQFNADHTFVMHLGCQQKLRKAGIASLAGTWKLRDADHLVITMSVLDKTISREAEISWENDQLVLREAGSASKMRKYPWPLPPAC